jgi:gamma-glutamylcyclotransferase (GGCT)/AIG2-like uncharacterized protein YtfP
MTAVFTYGSLMFAEVWDRVVRGYYASAAARVAGFRRYAVSGEAYPGVVREAGARVEGRLYFDVDANDQRRLDEFEGRDYQRVAAPVRLLEPASCGPAGSELVGELYLYLPADRLTQADWDPVAFERERMSRFIATFCRRRESD